jgi:hypothetical protein
MICKIPNEYPETRIVILLGGYAVKALKLPLPMDGLDMIQDDFNFIRGGNSAR